MYKIFFYKNKKGKEPVLEYISELRKSNSKDSRIKLNKIDEYIQILRQNGVGAGEPYIKHIDGDIWELRPLRNRIFFVVWYNESFILLHHFMKQTQKTPSNEIEKAKKEYEEILMGENKYE